MSKKIAEERINRLFQIADRRVSEDRDDGSELANRYVEIARNIGMKYNISIPENLRRKFCHECKSFLKPGLNCRVRINSKNSAVNYHCKECGKVNRYGF